METSTQQTYCSQLIVMERPIRAGEIRAYSGRAMTREYSLSVLLRDALDRGWPSVRAELVERFGVISPAERLAGEVASVLPATDRKRYEAERSRELLLTPADKREYRKLQQPRAA